MEKRTEILCPECFGAKLLTTDEYDAHCDKCKTEFIIVAKNTVRYK